LSIGRDFIGFFIGFLKKKCLKKAVIAVIIIASEQFMLLFSKEFLFHFTISGLFPG